MSKMFKYLLTIKFPQIIQNNSDEWLVSHSVS